VVLAVAAAAVVAAVPRDDALPDRVDAVVALGGSDARVTLARDIAAAHDAELVLSAGSIDFGRRQGLACDVDARCLRPDPDTTVGEARGMAELAAAHGWDTVVVATSSFHVNRSRLVFRQCLDDVAVVGTEDPASPEVSRRRVRELAGMLASLTVQRAC
jgi:uncharacterized SAM-binding protein YcdF (DUF218 family)